MGRSNRGVRTLPSVFAIVGMALLMSCGPNPRALDNRQWSDSFAFRITVDPSPPVSGDRATYKVVVQDKKTGEPIETGEGRVFANSKDGAATNDGLAKGKEVGTYYGQVFFVTSGDWAVGLQFRRDSTQRLEKVDWIQSVNSSPEK